MRIYLYIYIVNRKTHTQQIHKTEPWINVNMRTYLHFNQASQRLKNPTGAEFDTLKWKDRFGVQTEKQHQGSVSFTVQETHRLSVQMSAESHESVRKLVENRWHARQPTQLIRKPWPIVNKKGGFYIFLSQHVRHPCRTSESRDLISLTGWQGFCAEADLDDLTQKFRQKRHVLYPKMGTLEFLPADLYFLSTHSTQTIAKSWEINRMNIFFQNFQISSPCRAMPSEEVWENRRTWPEKSSQSSCLLDVDAGGSPKDSSTW